VIDARVAPRLAGARDGSPHGFVVALATRRERALLLWEGRRAAAFPIVLLGPDDMPLRVPDDLVASTPGDEARAASAVDRGGGLGFQLRRNE
jgi:hypothetical protein